MLSLRAVNQYYGSQHTLWNVDLELRSGECICVMGSQGMGKTTLVNCITGNLPVASGSITWQERGAPPCDLMPLSAHSRSVIGIGYVPQDRRIFSQLSVEENLHIALAAGGTPGAVVNSEIYDLFPQLYALRQSKGAALSEDDRYQLALARALIVRPRLLILMSRRAAADSTLCISWGSAGSPEPGYRFNGAARRAAPAVHSPGGRPLLPAAPRAQRGAGRRYTAG